MSRKVELYRREGNENFTNGKYFAAYDSYKKAIDECPQTDKTTLSVIYACISGTALLLERNSEAIDTATKAIELDPTNARAFFRRGNAFATNLAWEDAYQDYLQASKLTPGTQYFKDRVDFVKRKLDSPLDLISNAGKTQIPKQEDLPQQTLSPQLKPDVTLTQTTIIKNTSEFTPESIKSMMKDMLNDKRPSEQQILSMIRRVKEMHSSLPNVVKLNVPKIHVVGDTHGQLQDVINIFESHGYPSSENPYLFNGDFVDRGSQGSEIVISLMAWKLYDNNSIFLNRGNHETDAMNQLYGFYNECDSKYSKSMFSEFSKLFCALPIAHIINSKVIVLHGGLPSKKQIDIAGINRENRNCQPGDNSAIAEILWADPMESRGLAPSPRGVARQFGPDITEQFLRQNNLDLLIRSHQVQENGYSVQQNGKCITVFSAPNYVGHMGNKGAIVDLTFNPDGSFKREFKTFAAKPIPDKFKPMKYAAFSFY